MAVRVAAAGGQRGRPPPRAYIHGFTLVPEMWRPIAWARHEGALFVRLPGHATALLPSPTAASSPPWANGRGQQGDASAGDAFVAVVDQVADALAKAGCGPVHLVGYSMGARLALWLALRHPHRVAALSLVGVQPGLVAAAARGERARRERAWQQALLADGTHAFMEAWEAQPLFAAQQRLPAARRRHLAGWRRRHRAEGLAACLRVLGLAVMPDAWPWLPTLVPPTQFLAGAEDGRFVAVAERAARLPRQARAAVIADAGHNPAVEAPGAVAALLASWPPPAPI